MATFDGRIAELLAPFAATLGLDGIPGINRRTAETMIAEIGSDVTAFRSARAVIAVANTILTATYFILRDGAEYRDLGPNHFNRLTPEKVTRELVKRLEKLGHKVTLESAAA
jgi:hypothetical protein